MFSKYLPFLLFCLVALSVVMPEGLSTESLAQEGNENGASNIAWQDPFYTGPFGMKTWTDITGDHRVEGRFVELLPDKIVRLQRPDGRFLRIQLDQLSRADRDLVSQITLK